MENERAILLGVVLSVALFVAGVFVGRNSAKAAPAPPEQARAEVTHASGAVTLARVIPTEDEPAPPPLDLAPGTTTRIHAVTLEIPPSITPRTVQMDIQEGPDGIRVTTSGEGIKGTDYTIPRPRIKTTVEKWTLGAAYDGKGFGPMVAYSWPHGTAGAIATRNSVAVFAGIRF